MSKDLLPSGWKNWPGVGNLSTQQSFSELEKIPFLQAGKLTEGWKFQENTDCWQIPFPLVEKVIIDTTDLQVFSNNRMLAQLGFIFEGKTWYIVRIRVHFHEKFGLNPCSTDQKFLRYLLLQNLHFKKPSLSTHSWVHPHWVLNLLSLALPQLIPFSLQDLHDKTLNFSSFLRILTWF